MRSLLLLFACKLGAVFSPSPSYMHSKTSLIIYIYKEKRAGGHRVDYYKAKEMYKKYHCSLFSIFREEGGYEEFVREYSADTRALWAKEFLREDIDKFRKNPTFDNYYSISMVIANHHD